MIRVTLKSIVVGLAASVALVSGAHAGGFERGTADTDILFETGRFAARSSVTVVAPSLDIVSVLGGTPSSGYDAKTYMIPSAAVKLGISDNFACAGTYTTPFGAHNSHRNFVVGGVPIGVNPPPLSTTGSVEQEFVAHEFGATCSAGFEAGKGKLSLLGGLFLQDLDFTQFVGGPGGPIRFKLDDIGYGFRLGAAYEIPDIAFRAQVMYRSAVSHDPTGNLTTTAGGVTVVPFAFGSAEFPQSVEMKVQSGVAPGWLAFGSVKWTDWSVFETLNYTAFGPSSLNFFWRDGWTVAGGVAHRFNDAVAASLSLTWDRGVGTGHDIQTDRWTIATGVSVTPREDIEIRAGVGYTYIAGGVQNFAANAAGVPFASPGAAVQDAGYALAGNLSLKVKF